MKSLIFAGFSLDDLRDFPPEARRVVGHELNLCGLTNYQFSKLPG